MATSHQELADLYRQAILANAVDPCGHDVPIEATHRAELDNPLCGDRIVMLLKVADGHLKATAFEGEACAICLASSSLLCRHLPGQPTTAIASTLAAFERAVEASDNTLTCPEYLQPMLGVRAYPSRVNCATLPWQAAIKALEQPLAGDQETAAST